MLLYIHYEFRVSLVIWLLATHAKYRDSIPGRNTIFFFPTLLIHKLWYIQRSILWLFGTLSSEIKQPEHETRH
jgi:hypothetical protein